MCGHFLLQETLTMTSQARIEANRLNAQQSTGPRSAEGKARSSQNSAKHGFTARHITILPGEQPIYEEMLAQYQTELRPEGILELDFFHQILRASWDMRRASILEAGLLTGDTDPLADPTRSKDAERYARYYHRAQRLHASSLRRLRELQDLRAARAELSDHAAENLPPLADPVKSSKRTHFRAEAEFKQWVREGELQTELLMRDSLARRAAQNEPKPASKTPRNAQCPCGSGKKFKRCCGFNAPALLNEAA
jgi:hypothetical protein